MKINRQQHADNCQSSQKYKYYAVCLYCVVGVCGANCRYSVGRSVTTYNHTHTTATQPASRTPRVKGHGSQAGVVNWAHAQCTRECGCLHM